MGKKLEKATNGKYKMQMFPSMQLGGEKEMIEQAQVGALQIARISVGPMGPIVDELNVFNMPFVFRDEGADAQGDRRPDRRGDARQALQQLGAPGGARLDGRRHAQRLRRQAGDQARRPEGHEDPHDGQPAVRRDHERDGRQRHRDGLQRAAPGAAERRGRRRGEQRADAVRAEPLPDAQGQGLQPDRPPDHPRDLRLLEGELGQAAQGGPGPDQEAVARGAARAAQAVGRVRRRGHRQAQGRRHPVRARGQGSVLQGDPAGARQVRRQVRRPDPAHRDTK